MRAGMKILMAGVALFLPVQAMAQEGNWETGSDFNWTFHAKVPIKVKSELTYAADGDNERWLTNADIKPYLTLGLTDHIGIETGLRLKQVRGPEPGDTEFFQSHGLYVEQLKLTWTGQALSAFAGKYNPVFGIGWDKTPGIWNDEFTINYKTAERLGLGGSAQFGEGVWGHHRLSAGTFFADTTFLSGSVGTGRGRRSLSDGGASNTEDFSSFTLALDSQAPANIQGLNTYMGFRHQSPGDKGPAGDSENGYALGATYEFPVQDRYSVFLIGEYAGFSNFRTAPSDAQYWTAGGKVTIDEKWNVESTYTNRKIDPDHGSDTTDHMFFLDGGYTFANGIHLDGGYLYKQESEVDSHTIGTRLLYNFSF